VALVGDLDATLRAHGSLSLLGLLLPLVCVDLLIIALLALVDPWLLLAPWQFATDEIVLPLALEFALFFCAFPGAPHAGRAPGAAPGPARPRRAAGVAIAHIRSLCVCARMHAPPPSSPHRGPASPRAQ
jgi:hypothetical protein